MYIVMVEKRGILRGWLWFCCTGKLLAFLVGWLEEWALEPGSGAGILDGWVLWLGRCTGILV